MTEEKLNENDKKLLGFCYKRRRTVNEIARLLNITAASVSSRLDKLSKMGHVVIQRGGKGKKTYVRSREGQRLVGLMVDALTEIKRKGGSVTEEEFHNLFPNRWNDPEDEDIIVAPTHLLLHTPRLIVPVYKITKEADKFIKENQKKK